MEGSGRVFIASVSGSHCRLFPPPPQAIGHIRTLGSNPLASGFWARGYVLGINCFMRRRGRTHLHSFALHVDSMPTASHPSAPRRFNSPMSFPRREMSTNLYCQESTAISSFIVLVVHHHTPRLLGPSSSYPGKSIESRSSQRVS